MCFLGWIFVSSWRICLNTLYDYHILWDMTDVATALFPFSSQTDQTAALQVKRTSWNRARKTSSQKEPIDFLPLWYAPHSILSGPSVNCCPILLLHAAGGVLWNRYANRQLLIWWIDIRTDIRLLKCAHSHAAASAAAAAAAANTAFISMLYTFKTETFLKRSLIDWNLV